MDKQKIRAVVFDLDGTLLDTVQDIGAGANTALHRSGFPEHSREEYVRLVGHGIRRLMSLAVPEGTDPAALEEVLSFYLGYYPEHCTEKTTYFPGVQAMLHKLETAGYKLGVLSNKTEKTANKVISHYFSDVNWSIIWGNNGVRPLKPALDAGYLLCEELGLQPEEILYVGDGDTDMEFASKMGFRAAAATWGYRTREELRAAGAQVFLESTEDILRLLDLA